jgi:hypothetical protein
MGYSEPGGKLIHEKNQKQKISWHCPFKAGLEEYIFVQFMALSDGRWICETG